MKRRALAFCSSLLLVGLAPGSTLAVSNVDQSNAPSAALNYEVSSNYHFAQTFTAGITGRLTGVDLCLEVTQAQNVSVYIRAVGGTGMPTGSNLDSSQLSLPTQSPGWVHFPLSGAVRVTSGSQYAIILVEGTSLTTFAVWGDSYGGGQGLRANDAGDSSWNNDWTYNGVDHGTWDFAFQTYVDATTYAPGTYHPIDPVRLLDTRFGNGLNAPLSANVPATFQITGRGGVPSNAVAVTGNLTVVNTTDGWAVYLGPDPVASPASSTINFGAGATTANGLTVALGATGSLSATYMSGSGNTTDLVFDVTGYFTADSGGATYHPMAPARLLDTRSGNGLSGKFAANTPRTFQVTGRGGVPSNAIAVAGNVTVVNETNAWAVYVGPSPQASPMSSTLNFVKGDIKANNLTVALGSGGTLSATYMSSDGSTTDLVFDVTGYYTADATGARFVPLVPARLLDTRSGNGLSGKFAANTARTFQVTGRGGVPSNAIGVTGNVTVVNETNAWAVFVGPNPLASPTSSTLNFVKGDIKANGLTVALGSGGTLSGTYMSTAGNSTDLVFDVTGYFAP